MVYGLKISTRAIRAENFQPVQSKIQMFVSPVNFKEGFSGWRRELATFAP